MDTVDKLVDALSSLSRVAISLLTVIAVIAAYLLQRAINVMVAWTDPLSPQPQVSYLGLSFSYLTLSVLWPIVLGGLCMAFSAVVEKRTATHEALRLQGPKLDPKTLECIDPFAFNFTNLPGGVRVVRLFLLLPAISIMALLASQVVAFLRHAGPHGESMVVGEVLSRLHPGVWVAINLLLQLSAVVLGLLAVRGFPSKGLSFLGFAVQQKENLGATTHAAPNPAPAAGHASRAAEGP